MVIRNNKMLRTYTNVYYSQASMKKRVQEQRDKTVVIFLDNRRDGAAVWTENAEGNSTNSLLCTIPYQ